MSHYIVQVQLSFPGWLAGSVAMCLELCLTHFRQLVPSCVSIVQYSLFDPLFSGGVLASREWNVRAKGWAVGASFLAHFEFRKGC